MYYPRFTKVIIHHFMSKDPSISRRNKVNWHYVRDDFMFFTIKLVSRHQNTQQFGALLPIELTNDEIKNSNAYKEYYTVAIGEVAPKPKASARRARSGSDTSITPPTAAASPRLTAFVKGKKTAKVSKAKSLSALSEVAMNEAQQLKLVTKRSRQQMHISQASGSGANEGTGSITGVPDVPIDESEEELSWNSTKDKGADDKGKDDDDDEEDEGDDGEERDSEDDKDEEDEGEESNNDEQEVVRDVEKDDAEVSGDDDEEEGGSDEQEFDEETRDEESFDPIPQTLENNEDESNDEEDQGLNVSKEGHVEEEEEDELYRDVNINQGNGIQVTQEVEDSHVTLTPVYPDGQQESSSMSSQFVTSMLNPTLDTNQFAGAVSAIPGIVQQYMDQRMNEVVKVSVQIQSDRLRDEAQRENDEFLRTIDENIKKIIKETSYVVAADLSEMELKKILREKMEGNKSIQRSDKQRNLYKALVDAYEADKILLDTYEEMVTLKRTRDDEDKDEEPSARSDRGSKRRREGNEPESARAPTKTATKSASRPHKGLDLDRRADDLPIILSSQHHEWFSQQRKPPTPDRDWNKTLPAVYRSIQPWISKLAKQADTRSSFNELTDTPLDFSNFIMNRLRVDTLTSELLAGPTYELIKGSCKSLIELEYHLEEVYKATTDQLDWVNPKGQQYPHNLLQPLLLILDNRGRCVIPFEHFINNDLEYLRGGDSDVVSAINNLEKSDKDKAAAMIQAIDKRLKTRRIMRSLERFIGGKAVRGRLQDATKDHMIYYMLLLYFKRSILTDLQVTPTKPGRMTKSYSSHRFIADCFIAGNSKMEVKVPGSSCLTNS
uniref:Uncharacterized protein n=1 Tax=Tanacetum cinerariifolium TaxID=118510 RepID=A0A699H7E4_TANCI|nr:hypothetical protein [Tanacetum cinerariifolium]